MTVRQHVQYQQPKQNSVIFNTIHYTCAFPFMTKRSIPHYDTPTPQQSHQIPHNITSHLPNLFHSETQHSTPDDISGAIFLAPSNTIEDRLF